MIFLFGSIQNQSNCLQLQTPKRYVYATLIKRRFKNQGAQGILNIPICIILAVDRLVWHHSKHGRYYVRLRYQVAHSLEELPVFQPQLNKIISGKSFGYWSPLANRKPELETSGICLKSTFHYQYAFQIRLACIPSEPD